MKKFILAVLVIAHCVLISKTFAIYPPPVQSNKGMVVTEQYLASRVGAEILKQGGNAIDAAIAVGFALAVTEPCCGNIGGGGFMLIHLSSGKDTFVNFREKAPQAAHSKMYLDSNSKIIPNKSLKGYTAVAVPGTVLGFEYALKKYGTLPLNKVIEPAIKLARDGFLVSSLDEKLLAKTSEEFHKEANVAAIFLKNNKPYKAGDRLIQTQLAKSLSLLAQQGSNAFYKGSLAQEIVYNSQQHGGYLSLDDFAHYSVQELEPIRCSYRGYEIISAPPPSSGGVTLCQMLNILEGYDLAVSGYHSALSIHYIIEAMRYAYADRNNTLGDPDFVKNPLDHLLSKDYAKHIREAIQKYSATSPTNLPFKPPLYESTETTHYSVADKAGNLVAVTYTLNGFYGAHIIAGNTGFFLNNQMNDFTSKVNEPNQFGLIQGASNQIQPGKRPLSSMTPTFVFHNKQPFLVLGSPGGPRIITAILQTILNVIDYKMDIKSAVDEPRFHHQWLPEQIDIEAFIFSDDTLKQLAMMGYKFRIRAPWCKVEAIMLDSVSKCMWGANDDRAISGEAVGVD